MRVYKSVCEDEHLMGCQGPHVSVIGFQVLGAGSLAGCRMRCRAVLVFQLHCNLGVPQLVLFPTNICL